MGKVHGIPETGPTNQLHHPQEQLLDRRSQKGFIANSNGARQRPLEVSENSRREGLLEAKSRHSSPGQSRRDRKTAHPQRMHWNHCVCAVWRSETPPNDHNADRTIWCRDDIV